MTVSYSNPLHNNSRDSALGWIAAASIPEEPGAGKLHAGICTGAVGELAALPQ
jgi:hypothetical protein